MPRIPVAVITAGVFFFIQPRLPSLTAVNARADEARDAAAWCAPELSELSPQVCIYRPSVPAATEDRTLVLFLHSLIGAAPKAAWDQQRRMARNAESYGFTALVPRGRPGLGPGRDPEVLAWPTAEDLQRKFEAELLAEWTTAIELAKRKHGPFARILLFGFSNGAYYASNLAFRQAIDIDGVAVFAGGSGSKYQRLLAARAKRRVPLFIGYGIQDPDHRRQQEMVEMLRQLQWPHRALPAKVGHTVSDSQIRAALSYLGHPIPR